MVKVMIYIKTFTMQIGAIVAMLTGLEEVFLSNYIKLLYFL
jgi:hypothetical protein